MLNFSNNQQNPVVNYTSNVSSVFNIVFMKGKIQNEE